jgi:hypothetical protein
MRRISLETDRYLSVPTTRRGYRRALPIFFSMVSASARTTASFPADGQQVITACASRSNVVIENWKRAREARKPRPRIRLSLARSPGRCVMTRRGCTIVAQTLVSGLKAGRAVKRTSKRKRRSKVIPALGAVGLSLWRAKHHSQAPRYSPPVPRPIRPAHRPVQKKPFHVRVAATSYEYTVRIRAARQQPASKMRRRYKFENTCERARVSFATLKAITSRTSMPRSEIDVISAQIASLEGARNKRILFKRAVWSGGYTAISVGEALH